VHQVTDNTNTSALDEPLFLHDMLPMRLNSPKGQTISLGEKAESTRELKFTDEDQNQ
jgi:hypothetical protein